MALDSYRFLGGGATEERYVLFSDLFDLNDDESKNVFTLNKIQASDLYVRIYLEDSNIGVRATCTDSDTKKETLSKDSKGVFYESYLPHNSDCKLALVHTSKKHLDKKVFLEEKVRVTIMVAKYENLVEKYKTNHKDGLNACPTSQWPLALSKNLDVITNSDEQSYYNYPLVRYPFGTKYSSFAPIDMNAYYFRFNETQRFYFEVGSNFGLNHATLKLTPTSSTLGSFELHGKQMGNINVIDTDLPPGDYALHIQAYKNTETECGMFSFRGLLNMHSAMAQHLPGSSRLFRGTSMCEIRNPEEAPSQIYASEKDTRRGNEAVLDPSGNFFRFY